MSNITILNRRKRIILLIRRWWNSLKPKRVKRIDDLYYDPKVFRRNQQQ